MGKNPKETQHFKKLLDLCCSGLNRKLASSARGAWRRGVRSTRFAHLGRPLALQSTSLIDRSYGAHSALLDCIETISGTGQSSVRPAGSWRCDCGTPTSAKHFVWSLCEAAQSKWHRRQA